MNNMSFRTFVIPDIGKVTCSIEPAYVSLYSWSDSGWGRPVEEKNATKWVANNGCPDAVSINSRVQYLAQVLEGIKRAKTLVGAEAFLAFYQDSLQVVDGIIIHRALGLGVSHPFNAEHDVCLWGINPDDYKTLLKDNYTP